MTPGRIVVDRVSQRFRVSTQPQRTLKDLFVARGRPETREVWALRDVSLHGRAGRGGRARRPQRLRQDDAAEARLAHLQADRPAGSRPAGAVALAARARRRLPPRLHRPRERLPQRLDPRPLARPRHASCMDEIVAFAELERFIDLPVRTYSSGMYMRLGFAVAAHLEADVLLLDEVFAVGDEAFQRKCFGKIAEFKRRGGTIVFVSHDAQAVEMLCDRAVLLKQGADRVRRRRRARRSPATAQLLSADASPDELVRRAARVGERRGAGRLGAAARHRRRRAAAVRGRRAVRGRAARRLGARRARPAGLARAARRRRHRARRRHRRHRRPRLGGACGRARAALRGRPAAARRGSLPPPLLAARRRRRPPAALARRRGAVLRPADRRRRRGSVLLAGRWSMQEIDASEPIGARDHETT